MRNVRLSLLAIWLFAACTLLPFVTEAGQIPIFTGSTQLSVSQLSDYTLTIQGSIGTGATLLWPGGVAGQWNIVNNANAGIQVQYPGQGAPLQIAQGATQGVYGNGLTLFAVSSGSGTSISVTSATNDLYVSPSPGTGTFTIGATVPTNAQGAASTYLVQSSDMGGIVTHNSPTVPVTVSLNQAGTAGFLQGSSYGEVNYGLQPVTITPTTSKINNQANVVLQQFQSIFPVSDGTNYTAVLTDTDQATIAVPTATAFCTSPSVVNNNGAKAFTINVGSSCSTSTGTITFSIPAPHGWACTFSDITNPAANVPSQTGGTATTDTLTNYSRTGGTALNWTSSDVLTAICRPY